MKTLLVTALALSSMTSVMFAQQTPLPVTAATPAPQTAPAIPSATSVPEVIVQKDASPPHSSDRAMRDHRGHMPPPPPSKAAHFRIKSGDTMIDIKCADDEPTKVCSDVLNQVLDKLAPSSASHYDGNTDRDSDSDE